MSEGGGGGPEFGPRQEQLAPSRENLKGEEFEQALHPKVAKILQKVEDELKKYEKSGRFEGEQNRSLRGISDTHEAYRPDEETSGPGDSYADEKGANTRPVESKDVLAFPERTPSIPDLPPREYDSTNRSIMDVFIKLQTSPESATYSDLAGVLEGERKDLQKMEQAFEATDEYKMLKAATETAKNYLTDPQTMLDDKVNVSLQQNEQGEWEAKLGAEPGTVYFTFDKEAMEFAYKSLYTVRSNIGRIDLMKDMLKTMEEGKKPISRDNPVAIAIDEFIRKYLQEFENSRNSVDDDAPEARSADLAIAVFNVLYKKTHSYFPKHGKLRNVLTRHLQVQ